MKPVSQSPSLPLNVLADSTPVKGVRMTIRNSFDTRRMDHVYNNWSIYLIHQDESLTHVNMQDQPGKEFKILQYHKLYSFQKQLLTMSWDVSITASTPITASTIANRISVCGNIDNIPSSSDCREWVYTILDDLARQKYIRVSDLQEIVADLQRLYQETAEIELSPMYLETLLSLEQGREG